MRIFAWLLCWVVCFPGLCAAQNFRVFSKTPEKDLQVLEQIRHDLAVEWFGAPCPQWYPPIDVHVRYSSQTGGSTQYTFHDQSIRTGKMVIFGGDRSDVFEDVAPHEIMHLLLAEWIGKSIPRWIDEGVATYVERHPSRASRDNTLVQALMTKRGIPLNQLAEITTDDAYWSDVSAFYSQSHSLVTFLVDQGSKSDFIRYATLAADDQTNAAREVYGYKDLSDLQVKWNQWVKDGFPSDKTYYVGQL